MLLSRFTNCLMEETIWLYESIHCSVARGECRFGCYQPASYTQLTAEAVAWKHGVE